jgi:prepilin-type N-terminal cleavage/methylation domain-containing protein
VEEKRKMRNKKRKSQKKNSGFSLIELMISMAILLVLVGIVVLAGSRALRAANESSGSQTVSSIANAESAYQHEWQGFSDKASYLAGSEKIGTTAPTATADQELPTTTATALDTAYVNGNYNFVYKPVVPAFTDSAGQQVDTDFEVTGVPTSTSSGVKAFCASSTGVWFNTLGTGATPASGAGCATDGYTEQ